MRAIYFNPPAGSTNVRFIGFKQKIYSIILRLFWSFMPGFTLELLKRIFTTAQSKPLNDAALACLSRGRPFQIQVHGKTIHAWQWGTGPGILMVHGWNGRGSQFHHFVEPIVQAGFSAFAFDAPGHGDSDGYGSNYFEFTDVVLAMLSPNLGLNIQGLIGHSFGAAAIINSLDKENLALKTVCIAPILRLWELMQHTFTLFGIPEYIVNCFIADYESQFGYNLSENNPNSLIARLSAPILIIHDAKDTTAAYVDSAEAARSHHHVTLHTVQKLGHRRILSDQEVIDAALLHIGLPMTLENDQKRSDHMSFQLSIIQQYAAADENERLGLYLFYRDLREEFMEIDLTEDTTRFVKN